MIGWALTPILLVLALVCQATALHGRLDLIFLLTLLASRSSVSAGTAVGWTGGLLMGALRGNLSLPMALLYGTCGFLAGLYFENHRPPRVLEVVALVAGLTLSVAVGEGLLMLWLGLPLEPVRALILPALGVNLVALTPILSRR